MPKKAADYESTTDWTLAMYLDEQLQLPDERSEFPKNMLPITAADRVLIDEKCGRSVADAVLHMQVEQARRGGVNPGAREALFPEGLDGEMDLDALHQILANFLVWEK